MYLGDSREVQGEIRSNKVEMKHGQMFIVSCRQQIVVVHQGICVATGVFLKIVNGKSHLLLEPVNLTMPLFEEMYAEISFGTHLVEEGEVELSQPVVQTAGNEEL